MAAAGTGIWKKDSVKDVAESVGIANLPDDVASALAGDVEYRLWEIIEESIKFMRHSHRTRLKVDDVDQALRVRNLEPLWGFHGGSGTSALPPFKKTVTPTGIVYSLDDDEIDLAKVVRTELPSVPRDISFTAHWLAIEGVQPLIKENPTPAELATYATRNGSNAPVVETDASGNRITPLVKHVLSRELQLYFTRLTDALGTSSVAGGAAGASGATQDMRDAALGSVRSDPGLHQLVPYLIGWGGEQIANHLEDLQALERALDLFHAMLENPTLYIEPYLHQLTPPVLTCLLTSALPNSPSSSLALTGLTPLRIRTSAAALLHLLLARHSAAYPSLRPRVTKTLLRGLGGPGRGLGARWGAARGLSGVVSSAAVSDVDRPDYGTTAGGAANAGSGGGGNLAVREWVGGGLKALGELCEAEPEAEAGERTEVVREVFNVLRASLLPTTFKDKVDNDGATGQVPPLSELQERYGSLFGKAVYDRWNDGGRDIWEQVKAGSETGAQTATITSGQDTEDAGARTSAQTSKVEARRQGDAAQDQGKQTRQEADNNDDEDDEDDEDDDEAMEEV